MNAIYNEAFTERDDLHARQDAAFLDETMRDQFRDAGGAYQEWFLEAADIVQDEETR